MSSWDEFQVFLRRMSATFNLRDQQPQTSPPQSDDAGGGGAAAAVGPFAATVASGPMVKVTVGIDDELRMILEMDPSIVDLGGVQTAQPHGDAEQRLVVGLPPISGG